ncbi:MAG: hypothetical protein NTW95_11025 [Candidatus Aminicenantes bacterium]|nr:hypothetical protein [Candidatus Aminicenantes bacterium]
MEKGGSAWVRVNCPFCGSPDSRLRYPASKGKEEIVSTEHFRCTSTALSRHGNIVQCSRCRLVFSNPQLQQGEVLDIYRAVEDPLYLEEATARERTFARSLLQLHAYAKPPGRLLDVGCYTGVFMKTAAAAGPAPCARSPVRLFPGPAGGAGAFFAHAENSCLAGAAEIPARTIHFHRLPRLG